MIAAFESVALKKALSEALEQRGRRVGCSSPCLLPALGVRSKRPCAVGQSSGFHSWSTKEILLVPFWCSLEDAHAKEPDGRLTFHTDYAVELIGMCFMEFEGMACALCIIVYEDGHGYGRFADALGWAVFPSA
jgi:hypothetical protein